MTRPTTSIERELDSLLRGEISAAETYKLALDRIDDPATSAVLREIQEDHGDAIRFLYEQIAERGVEPSSQSGPWGAFARTVEGAATLISDKTALSALREGEVRGLRSYETALEKANLPNDAKVRFRDTYVPRQQRHLQMLDRLIAAE